MNTSQAPEQSRNSSNEAGLGWLYFNIYDMVQMQIKKEHPSSYSIAKSFGPFQVEQLEHPNLILVGDVMLEEEHSFGTTVYEFSPTCTVIKARKVSVALRNGEILLAGWRDLLSYVTPLIQWLLLEKGATIVHGASVAINGQGVLMPAWGGTGKTSAVIELLKLAQSEFMGDDLAIIRKDNTLLSFPKPFFIYPYHRDLFPHLFRNKPKIIVPACMSNCVAAVRQLVRPMLSRWPKLEQFCRKFTPEHMQVAARQALPDAKFVDAVPLKLVVFLERYTGTKNTVDELDAVTARHRVVGNLYFELGIYAQQLMTACGATGLFGLEDWFSKMGEVVDKVFEQLPVYRLRMPPMKPELTGKTIASTVSELLAKS